MKLVNDVRQWFAQNRNDDGMSVYESTDENGVLFAIQIKAQRFPRSYLRQLLNKIDGITEVQDVFFENGDRFYFKYYGTDFVVHQLFGCDKYYYIGPLDPDNELHAVSPKDMKKISLFFSNIRDRRSAVSVTLIRICIWLVPITLIIVFLSFFRIVIVPR